LALTAVQISSGYGSKRSLSQTSFFARRWGLGEFTDSLDSRQSVVHGKAMMQTSGRPSSVFEMQMEQYGKGLFQSECV